MATEVWVGTKVCALGEFTSILAASYLEHVGEVEWGEDQPPPLLHQQLRKALESANLPVSTNIISNLLKALEEHQKEKGSASGGPPLSWGEFCACCIALHAHQTLGPGPRVSATGPKTRTHLRPSPGSTKHEVFLGGSCNPTTWRLDMAVPALQQASITYFNPQVDEWFPELIEVEEQAKSTATLQLFVVDNQTRAISSMVEIAYLAGQEKDLVAVVEDIAVDGATIAGETLSAREVEDLNRGRLFVRNLIEEGGCFLADTLHSALTASIQVVKQQLRVHEYCTKCMSRRIQYVPPSLGEELDLLHRVFTMYDNDKKKKLSLNEAELALRSLHVEGATLQQLLTVQQESSLTVQQESSDFSTSSAESTGHTLLQQYREHGLSFDEFCSVYAELKFILLKSSTDAGSLLTAYFSTPLKWIASWFWSVPVAPPTRSAPFVDVFLNGSCGSTSWRSDVSIPMLKQHGVSYFNPQVANWDRRLLPIEREAKERCSVLLYVIAGETLSVASLVEAAYYIGKGRAVVLCVSDIPCQDKTAKIEGMELNAHAVKDYNRGRAYLTSMANKSRIPVYSTVAAATSSAVQIALCLRGQKVQSQHLVTLPSHSSSV